MGTQKTARRGLKNITYKERLGEWGSFFWRRRDKGGCDTFSRMQRLQQRDQ